MPEFTGPSIDPTTWEDPKQSFPGLVEVSRYRLASERYREANEWRPAIVEDITQWDIRVRRLDAVRVGIDGAQRPAVYPFGPEDLASVDLQKWSNAEQAVIRVNSRHHREYLMCTEFKRLFGTVEPPEILEGKMAMFDYWSQRSMPGGNIPVRNVLVPTSILPPDYEYKGEVRVFQDRPREEGDGDAGNRAAAGGNPSGDGAVAANFISEEEAIDWLVQTGLPGKSIKDAAGILTSLPAEMRSQTILTGIATGSIVNSLIEEGRIQVTADDTIVAAS